MRIFYFFAQDIKKANHYFTRAAYQNEPKAQFLLGFLYKELDELRDINKAIHYLSLAANQIAYAQFYLGKIYYNGESTPKNI
ncbi:hypothetical protein M9Y10_018066, partial [Tritrichomonas musculus]